MLKGMLVDVFRNTLGDSTNGGITSQYDSVYLIGPGIPGLFEVPEGATNVLRMDARGEHRFARPFNSNITSAGIAFNSQWWMMGGNFIWSTDGRFPSAAPIPVHDRTETAEQMRSLSP